jgi:hypothetical protein
MIMRAKTYRCQLERLEDRTVPAGLNGTIPAAAISNVSGSGSVEASSTSILISGSITTNGVTVSGSISVTPGSGRATVDHTATPSH